MYTAVIPVREGSQRLRNKNIAPFGETNLLIHKIRQLKQVSSIDRIVVTSDSDAMLEMASAEGAATHKRAPEYCDEKTKSFGEVVRHIAESVEGDHIVWAQCTLPLIVPRQYEEMIAVYKKDLGTQDSLVAVEPFKKYVWDDRGPVNYKLGLAHVPSQELPQWYFVFGASIAPRETMIRLHHHIGNDPYKYPLPKVSCVDVDDELDLAAARAWYPLVEKYTA